MRHLRDDLRLAHPAGGTAPVVGRRATLDGLGRWRNRVPPARAVAARWGSRLGSTHHLAEVG